MKIRWESTKSVCCLCLVVLMGILPLSEAAAQEDIVKTSKDYLIPAEYLWTLEEDGRKIYCYRESCEGIENFGYRLIWRVFGGGWNVVLTENGREKGRMRRREVEQETELALECGVTVTPLSRHLYDGRTYFIISWPPSPTGK